jgi:RNA polymerase sigma factor (sigma-70 family)
VSSEGFPRDGDRGANHSQVDQSDLVDLVNYAVLGDQAAWDALVGRFSRLVWGICSAYRLNTADAGDVFQLTWLRLLEHLDSIREPARLPGWLATTCRRECQVQLRRNRRLQPIADERLLNIGSDEPAADQPVLVADRNASLWVAFSRLSERCQQILRVLVVTPEEGPPSYHVAAKALGLPTGSLGPTRMRCLDRLREILGAEGISGLVVDS